MNSSKLTIQDLYKLEKFLPQRKGELGSATFGLDAMSYGMLSYRKRSKSFSSFSVKVQNLRQSVWIMLQLKKVEV